MYYHQKGKDHLLVHANNKKLICTKNYTWKCDSSNESYIDNYVPSHLNIIKTKQQNKIESKNKKKETKKKKKQYVLFPVSKVYIITVEFFSIQLQ